MGVLFAAILWLAPGLGEPLAQSYAVIVQREATARKIDPLLVLALISRESGFIRTSARKRNYGLMQVRVTRRLHAEYFGEEQRLFDAAVNVRAGVELLSHFRAYHRRRCGSSGHWWWAHYQWGYRVRNPGSGNRVNAVYRKLRRRFSE